MAFTELGSVRRGRYRIRTPTGGIQSYGYPRVIFVSRRYMIQVLHMLLGYYLAVMSVYCSCGFSHYNHRLSKFNASVCYIRWISESSRYFRLKTLF